MALQQLTHEATNILHLSVHRTMLPPQHRRAVGQLFAVGFNGTDLNQDITSLIRDYAVGAIVLFKRNIQDAEQLQSLCLGLQTLAKEAGHTQPLLIGIDQENGLVTRISPPVAAQLPGSMALGAAASLEDAYQVAKATGETLRCFGINMNYAPVGDVNNEPLNPVIGVRSHGDDPEKVAQLAVECARGLRETRVSPCIKHYPGHGDTTVDSHHELPVINKSREELEKTELIPFQRAVADGIEAVMTAHISLPGLGGSSLPATLSPEAIRMLRDDLKFRGVILTDCMEMDGIRAGHGTVEGSLLAIKAGVDSVMICHTYQVQTAAIDRVCEAIDSGDLPRARIDASLRRLGELKRKFTSWEAALARPSLSALVDLNQRNEALAGQVYAKSTTMVRCQPNLLPLPRTGSTVVVFPGIPVPTSGVLAPSGEDMEQTRAPWVSGAAGDRLRRYNSNVMDVFFTDTGLSPDQWEQVDNAAVVILATRNAREAQHQRHVGLAIAERCREKTLIVIATCSPHDFLDDEAEMKNYMALYEPTLEAFSSAAAVLYGALPAATGTLPVAH